MRNLHAGSVAPGLLLLLSGNASWVTGAVVVAAVARQFLRNPTQLIRIASTHVRREVWAVHMQLQSLGAQSSTCCCKGGTQASTMLDRTSILQLN